MQTLDGYLREKRLLLVLDNFEQVLDAVPSVAGLLAQATGAVDIVEPRCQEVLAHAEALGDTRAAHHANHFFADCALMGGGACVRA